MQNFCLPQLGSVQRILPVPRPLAARLSAGKARGAKWSGGKKEEEEEEEEEDEEEEEE